MTMKAPAGPPICTDQPPRAEIRKPATMAVTRPASGLTPEAIAKAMASGRATTPTVTPAPRSARKRRRSWPGRVSSRRGWKRWKRRAVSSGTMHPCYACRGAPPRGGAPGVASAHPHARQGTRVRLEDEDARMGLLVGVAGGQHHAIADAELHLARREVGDHHGALAHQHRRVGVGGADAREHVAVAAFTHVQGQAQQLVAALHDLGV